jgi:methylated-DNA-[protein]-cysteine S-methyltransferase
MSDDLRSLAIGDIEEASRLAAGRVAEQARARGLLDVSYTTFDSPIGDLLVLVTRRGLVRLAFPEEPRDAILEDVAETVSRRVLEDPKGTVGVRRELDDYFEGHLRRFRTPIDWTLSHPGFSLRVLEATARIPFGSVSTYGDVALRAGSPRAARAAGNALHDNPVPIVVPCHRVVPAGGGIGRYGGQEWRKEFLLRLEGALRA